MPVTVRPASHPARKVWPKPATSAQTLFEGSCPKPSRQSKRIVQSSFPSDLTAANICASSNGLVMAVYEAYSQHHHLTILPEDIWLCILTQLNFHINAHAENLHSSFVSHKGQKQLVVTDVGKIENVDVGRLAVQVTKAMDECLVDKDLYSWIMPSFSTTTPTDTVTAAIIMMGSMQKYFGYTMSLICGIPSVTLLGEKADWFALRRRIDKLPQFGAEPRTSHACLHLFLTDSWAPSNVRMIRKVVNIWSKIADRHSNGSGPSYLSGWVTAFCFWSAEGEVLYRESSGDACQLDGVAYHRVDTADIPNAYVSVPVLVEDNGKAVRTKMVAGLVGMRASSSKEKLDVASGHKRWVRKGFGEPEFEDVETVVGDATGLDSLQPVVGWWIFELEAWVKE